MLIIFIMIQNKEVCIYSNDIEVFKLSLYRKDPDEFMSILMFDIDNQIYETMHDLTVQIPFLRKFEYEKLRSYFNSEEHLRRAA